MLDLDPAIIHQYKFGQFKGFLAENAEIEFLFPKGGRLIPVEVKAGINTKAKSLQVFRAKYETETAVLLTALGANQLDNGLLHSPLYLADKTLGNI